MLWEILLLSSIILLLLCKLETRLQYTAKMFMFYSLCTLLATFTLPFGILRPFNPSNHSVLSFTVPYLAKYILNVEVEVRDGHNAKLDKPFVLVLNHQSSIDAFIMMHIWPDRCVTIMKRELMFIFPFGVTSWLFGSIFINRASKDQAKSSMELAGEELKSRNLRICVFPEGTRNRDGKLLPFKKGAFNLAVSAQVPIVPGVISCYKNFYSKKENRFVPGKVIVTVLPAVETQGKTYDDVIEITDRIRESMIEVYERASVEVASTTKLS